MRKTFVGIGGVQIALLRRERVRVIVEPARVGADACDRLDGADPAAGEIAPARAVAVGAVFGVQDLAARRQFGIDRERVFGRLVCVRAQPIGDKAQRIPGRAGSAPRRSRTRRCGCAPRRCRCCRPNAAASPPPRADPAATARENRRCRPIRAAAAFRSASSAGPLPARTYRSGPDRASPRGPGSGSGSAPGSAPRASPAPRRIAAAADRAANNAPPVRSAACTTCQGLKRSSSAQSVRNCVKRPRSRWLAGMPATTTGRLCAVSR